MRYFILAAALTIPGITYAAPSSQVAWSPNQLNFVKAGNLQKGKVLAQNCNACHGASGISSMNGTPSLAAQLPTYLFKQLQDYAKGNRQHAIMSGMAKNLSEQDMADVAAWFASLAPTAQPNTPPVYENAQKLIKDGSNERIIPPCEVCHGGNGQGQKIDIPALAGQNAEYIKTTLNAFKDGSRHNDVYSKMRSIAQNLSEQEIGELGFYYQNIKK